MNVFVRYFDHETLAKNMDEIVAFLNSLEEVRYDEEDLKHIDEYLQSSNTFPFRLKVSFSNYILFLKTEANNMDGFRLIEQQRQAQRALGISPAAEKKRNLLEFLNEEHVGWYDAQIVFKRVVQVPGTNKFQYQDAPFHARLKATSGMHCYTRITEHLRNRQDVDSRSQFPSAKSNNFTFEFLGENPE